MKIERTSENRVRYARAQSGIPRPRHRDRSRHGVCTDPSDKHWDDGGVNENGEPIAADDAGMARDEESGQEVVASKRVTPGVETLTLARCVISVLVTG
jgi:hypothetical protein